MRNKIAMDYEREIKNYCNANGLSYDKIRTSPCCYDDEELIILDPSSDPEREALGLMDNIPMSATLEIYLENGKLRFEQTDITRKYLGADKKVADAARTVAKPTMRPSIPSRPKLAYA